MEGNTSNYTFDNSLVSKAYKDINQLNNKETTQSIKCKGPVKWLSGQMHFSPSFTARVGPLDPACGKETTDSHKLSDELARVCSRMYTHTHK